MNWLQPADRDALHIEEPEVAFGNELSNFLNRVRINWGPFSPAILSASLNNVYCF